MCSAQGDVKLMSRSIALGSMEYSALCDVRRMSVSAQVG